MSQPMGSSGSSTRRGRADQLKRRFDWLQAFSDEELGEIHYCAVGEPMSPDEEYFDLCYPERGIIRGEEGTQTPEGSCYVPRSEVPAHLWDKMVRDYS